MMCDFIIFKKKIIHYFFLDGLSEKFYLRLFAQKNIYFRKEEKNCY